jgi:hypothetical protein
MADLFELRGVDIELKVLGKTYKFQDPPFNLKVASYRAADKLEENRKNMSLTDYLIKANELNRESVKMYLPDLPSDILEKIGMHEMSALIDKINELSGKRFGATVEKVEKK